MVVNRNPAYFFAIVREQNITRAAEKLYITQSSLSQYIAKLEQDLGVTLFDRNKNSVTLTEAGKIYLRYLESESYLYEKLVSDLNRDCMQSLDIGIGSWRGSILLPDVLEDFLLDYPNVRVNLHEYPVSELFTQVRDNKVDFAIMNTHPEGVPSGLLVEHIIHERIFLVMSKENLLAQDFARTMAEEGGKLDLKRLTEERFISLFEGQTVGRHVNNFFQKNKMVFPKMLFTTNIRTALRLTGKNMGFCMMVEQGLAEIQEQDKYLVFNLNDKELELPLSIISKANSYRSPICQDMIDRINDYYTDLAIRNNERLQ